MEQFRAIAESGYLDEDVPENRFSMPNTDVGSTVVNKKPALTITDLETNPAYLDPIRDYMIDRKGKHFATKKPEELVDAFTRHMRFFNTNEAITLAEALYMKKADEEKRTRAGEAYKVYDQLGNVFVNDGMYGAVNGVFDYISAIASSPSTYLGFGVGKGLSWLSGKAAKEAIKKSAETAYKANLSTSKKAAREAYNEVIKKGFHNHRTKVVLNTGLADAAVTVGQDATLQETEIQAGSRETFNPIQTGLSAFGSLAGTTLGMSTLPKTSSRAYLPYEIKRAAEETQTTTRITKEQQKRLGEEVKKSVSKSYGEGDIFREQAKEGEKIFVKDSLEREATEIAGPATVGITEEGDVFVQRAKQPKKYYDGDLVSKIIGNKADDTYILDSAARAGVALTASMSKGDKIATVLGLLSRSDAKDVGDLIFRHTGLRLGDVHDNIAPNISATVSKSIQNAARTLVATQGKKLREDAAYVQGKVYQTISDEQAMSRDFADEIVEAIKEERKYGYVKTGIGYAQNLWKRMLVSAPQTTAVNVFGWGQYYTANSIAEVLQGGIYTTLGYLKGGSLTEAGKKDVALGKAMFDLQREKFKNLFDPYTTYDSYMELMSENPKLKQRLFDTFSGGVERTAKRFDIKETNVIFRGFESIADAASTISLVRAQDTITKSQMFVNSIDKQLRIQKGLTFSEALEKGDLSELSEDVVDKALEDTMKSVFSYDYTRAKGMFNDVARIVESISGNPVGGFVLPFGRFMNNVVAFAHSYGPTGMFPAMAAMFKGQKVNATEAFSKAVVGSTALLLGYQYQKENARKGLAYNEMETGGGDIIDIGNTFPLSLIMATGRYVDTALKGGEMKDITEELLKQIAIGQTAKDLSFGNDLTKLVSNIQQSFSGDSGGRHFYEHLFVKGLGTLAGNIGSGYTRFLDPVNRVFGYYTDTDPGIDRRLADTFGETLSLNASKYTDNIIEGLTRIFSEDKDYLMGEKQQLAYRGGDVYDPSPFQTMQGVRVKQPRTYAEIVFGMVNKPNWRTNMYTGIPEHDNYVNRVITPLIEEESRELLERKGFHRASLRDKQGLVKGMLNRARARIRDNMTRLPYLQSGIDYRKVKIDRGVSDKDLADAKDTLGISNSLRKMTRDELDVLDFYLKNKKDFYKEGFVPYD